MEKTQDIEVQEFAASDSEEALLADFGVLVAAEYDYSLGG